MKNAGGRSLVLNPLGVLILLFIDISISGIAKSALIPPTCIAVKVPASVLKPCPVFPLLWILKVCAMQLCCIAKMVDAKVNAIAIDGFEFVLFIVKFFY